MAVTTEDEPLNRLGVSSRSTSVPVREEVSLSHLSRAPADLCT